jgi:hypothetical protein
MIHSNFKSQFKMRYSPTLLALFLLLFGLNKVQSQVSATVSGGNCAGSFTLNANGTANGQNKFSGTVAITVSPFPTQNIPVDMQWSGTRWEIVAAAPVGVVFSNTAATSPNPPCFNVGNWVAGQACVGGSFTASSGNCSLIPVELYHFSGKNWNNRNHLVWQTANEINNLGFEIERSGDAKTWEKLDFVAGKGDNSTYQFTDKDPLSKSYYRLKQLDYNSDFEYSKTILIESNRKNSSVNVFPNPITEGVLSLDNLPRERTDIQLVNAVGQVVWQQTTQAEAVRFDIKNKVQKGIYILTIRTGNDLRSQKIVVE